MMTYDYREGDLFAIPLPDGRYSIGLVARVGKRKRVVFGYFFADVFHFIPNVNELPNWKSTDAVLRARFGDLGIVNGEWKVIGAMLNWSRSDWLMPSFVSRDSLYGRITVRKYSDSDPGVMTSSIVGTEKDLNLPSDAMSGYKALIVHILKIISH